MPKNFDWVTDLDWKAQIQQAWEEYERLSALHLLNRYFHLVDEASVAMGIVELNELRPGLGDCQAPSLKDMW